MKPIYIVLRYDFPIGIFDNDSQAFMLAKTEGEASDEHGVYDTMVVYRISKFCEIDPNLAAYMMWEDGKMTINPFKKL